MTHLWLFLPGLLALSAGAALAGDPPRILTNHLGYDSFLPKRAVIQGSASNALSIFEVRTYPEGALAFRGTAAAGTPVDRWREWKFWSLDFSDLQREGTYVIEARDGDRVARSFPFRIEKNILERHTLSDVLYYFKTQRSSGEYDKADRKLAFRGSSRAPVDVHGGWYDATGDYGMHLSHLDATTYFNPQQEPLVALSLGKTLALLGARHDANYRQIAIRLADELAWGADFLVRMHVPQQSFYETIDAYAGDKDPAARRIVPSAGGQFEVGFRNGGGVAVAALALAARSATGGEFDRATYLRTAEEAFGFLQSHNAELLSDGKENILDDYCALMAASELYRSTRKAPYAAAAKHRAAKLIARLTESGGYKDYWRADDHDRPFFHAADVGAPVVALLDYYEVAPQDDRQSIRDAVRRSLEFELRVTNETANPFGLARQYVQSKSGARRTSFFFPHDTEAAPWWQGENARLASLAAAARLAAPLFEGDPAFQTRLEAFAADQLNWILGLNPFDTSMLQGTGRNNPEYMFYASWQYKSAPGGICNGITAGLADEHDIDFNVPYAVSGQDADWRWTEQWLPHASWYLLAAAAGPYSPRTDKVLIGYVFPQDRVLAPAEVMAEKLTHINYAFANIRDGEMVEGFAHDTENFQILNAMKSRNPKLQILVSVGGWTWSGGFSDVALTAESRKKFIDSATRFLTRHGLDGLDIDWEYPGQKGVGNPYRAEDKENCTALVAELRAALDRLGAPQGKHYLLTMATQAADVWLAHTEMDQLQRDLDFVNLMAYDQTGDWDAVTGHHAPLFSNPESSNPNSAALVVTHYLSAGVPARKLVLGVPFYGHAWGEVPATGHGLFQIGKKAPEGLATAFKDIRTLLAGPSGYTRYWDDISMAPYLYDAAGRTFISYEDEQSVREKARFVVDRGLAGIMFWAHGNDPDGTLQTAVDEALKGGR